MKALGAVVNDWQLSGVYTGGSGVPYDARYSYQTNGANVNLTGLAELPGEDRSQWRSGQRLFEQPVQAVQHGGVFRAELQQHRQRVGRESAARVQLNFWDLAISRHIPLGGGRNLQFRFDLFNAFNTVVYNAVQTQSS